MGIIECVAFSVLFLIIYYMWTTYRANTIPTVYTGLYTSYIGFFFAAVFATALYVIWLLELGYAFHPTIVLFASGLVGQTANKYFHIRAVDLERESVSSKLAKNNRFSALKDLFVIGFCISVAFAMLPFVEVFLKYEVELSQATADTIVEHYGEILWAYIYYFFIREFFHGKNSVLIFIVLTVVCAIAEVFRCSGAVGLLTGCFGLADSAALYLKDSVVRWCELIGPKQKLKKLLTSKVNAAADKATVSTEERNQLSERREFLFQCDVCGILFYGKYDDVGVCPRCKEECEGNAARLRASIGRG